MSFDNLLGILSGPIIAALIRLLFQQSSTIPTYQKLNAVMESAKPSVYTDGNSGGIDRVRKEDGFYAFFMEAAVIEYHIERKCDLTMIGGMLDSKGYGIALPLSKMVQTYSCRQFMRHCRVLKFHDSLITHMSYFKKYKLM